MSELSLEEIKEYLQDNLSIRIIDGEAFQRYGFNVREKKIQLVLAGKVISETVLY